MMKNFDEYDREFMKMALVMAQEAANVQEVPVGCVIVSKEGVVLSKAHNRVENCKDATCHAEILAIREAAKHVEDWRLIGATLYVTLEPCIMCSGAAILSRISRIVWGCPDFRHGANGSLLDVFATPHPIHRVELVGGLMEEESKQLMQQFFQKRRRQSCLK